MWFQDEFEKKKKEVAEPARDKFYAILTKEYKVGFVG